MAYIIRDDPGGAVPQQSEQGKGARVAKKRKKKAGVTCLSCGAGMKRKDAACRRCGAPTALGEARKAMAAGGVTFIGKSMRPRCPRCGNASRPTARHCTSCGTALLTVVKSAAEQSRDHYLALMRQESNPEARQGWWQLANPDLYGKGTAS